MEHIVIPRIQFVITYIKLELEERANEEKFTIKKILEVKKKHKDEEEKMKGKAMAEAHQNDHLPEATALDAFGEDEPVDKEDKLFG